MKEELAKKQQERKEMYDKMSPEEIKNYEYLLRKGGIAYVEMNPE